MTRILAALVLLTLTSACGSPTADNPTPTGLAAAAQAAGTVNGLCPVLERPVVPDVLVEYQGQKIGFCCGPCPAKFLKDPEKYLDKMRKDPAKYGYKP